MWHVFEIVWACWVFRDEHVSTIEPLWAGSQAHHAQAEDPLELLEVYVLSFVSVTRVIEGLMMYVGALYIIYILWIPCGVLRFFFPRSWCVQPKNWCVDERFWAILVSRCMHVLYFIIFLQCLNMHWLRFAGVLGFLWKQWPTTSRADIQSEGQSTEFNVWHT